MNSSELPTFADFFALLSNLPTGQLLFLALSGVLWVVGGNMLTAMHYKRKGKHWTSGFLPFAFPFKAFNSKEWGILFLLLIICMSLATLGMSFAR
jgi:hypothetical protein